MQWRTIWEEQYWTSMGNYVVIFLVLATTVQDIFFLKKESHFKPILNIFFAYFHIIYFL